MPMMRQPSSYGQLYAWHSAVLTDPRHPMVDGDPQCGWFKTRLVKGGPFVAARIWCEREIDVETGELAGDEILRCEVGGERRDPMHAWLSLRPISRAAYDHLIALPASAPGMAATMVQYDNSRRPMRPL